MWRRWALRILCSSVLSAGLGMVGSVPVAADPECDADADRTCDSGQPQACTTANGRPGHCRQRSAGCNCEAPTSIVFSACAGGSPPASSVVIGVQQEVAFVLDGDCTSVQISGAGPIGTFSLGVDGAVNILFPAVGVYSYGVNGGAASGSVTVVGGGGVPSSGTGTLALFTGLLACAAGWAMRRRRIG